MKISVNGRVMDVTAPDLEALLTQVGVAPDRRGIAVAIDGAVVPRSEWKNTSIENGAAVEIVGAVQGG
jgi:sulfur carrier protein